MDRGLLGQLLLGFQPPKRDDGTLKGEGFFGLLPTPDGRYATELSIGIDQGFGEESIPSLVPGLTAEQINYLRNGGFPTDEIIRKAAEFAGLRGLFGFSPFAGPGEQNPGLLPTPFRRQR